MADNASKIAEINELLESGVTWTSVDGVQTRIDTESLRRQVRQLEAEDDSRKHNRPVAASIDFSNCF